MSSLVRCTMASRPGLRSLRGSVTLALLILASLDVRTRTGSEGKLEIGVHVNLGNAHRDGLLDLVHRNAGATMQKRAEGRPPRP